MPKDQTASSFFLDREQVQLFTQHSVITFLGFFQQLFVLFQLLGFFPRRGVDALQHFAVFVSPPVGAGHRLQLDRLFGQAPRRLHVGTGTQVPPLVTNVVNGNGFGFDAVQDFQFEGFSNLFNAAFGFFSADFFSCNGVVFGNNLVHGFFDFFEILIRQLSSFHGFSSFWIFGFREKEIVVKAIVNPRSNGDLRFGVHLLHRHGHDMGRRVTDFQQVFIIVVGREFRFGLFFFGVCRLLCRGGFDRGHPTTSRG
mmetsp:Transcript_48/g.76  ORF Transcript_48/g.76 Transcript_48/m.76 type:complete len:254 (-) Transcript_48:327-1088(-)